MQNLFCVCVCLYLSLSLSLSLSLPLCVFYLFMQAGFQCSSAADIGLWPKAGSLVSFQSTHLPTY